MFIQHRLIARSLSARYQAVLVNGQGKPAAELGKRRLWQGGAGVVTEDGKVEVDRHVVQGGHLSALQVVFQQQKTPGSGVCAGLRGSGPLRKWVNCLRKMAPGFIWVGSGMGRSPWHRKLQKEETWRQGAARQIRKRAKKERKQVAPTEVLPKLIISLGRAQEAASFHLIF